MRGIRFPLWAGELFVLAAAGGLLMWAMRDFTFLMDEWNFVQSRLSWRGETFLYAHNQHLLALDVLIYKVLFETVGIDSYLPYRLVGVLAHLLCAVLMFEFARRRLGTALAAMLVAPVLVLGSGRFLVLFPFNMQWTLSLAALIGVLFLLERSFRGRDLAITVLLVVAVTASSLGVPIAVAVLLAVLLDRDRWRRLWVPAVPLGLWLVWYAEYGADAGRAPGYESSASPIYLFHLAAGGVGGLFGVPMGVHQVVDRPYIGWAVHLLTLTLAGGLAVLLVRRQRRLSPQVVVVITTTVLFWATLTITRGYLNSPYATHYVYVSVVLIVLIVAAVVRVPALSPLALGAAVVAMSLAVAANIVTLVSYADERRESSSIVTAEVTALEIARDTVEPDYRPDHHPERAPQLRARLYLTAVDRLDSSPAAAPAELLDEPESVRATADRVLKEAQRPQAIPYTVAVRRYLAASGVPPPAPCRRVHPGPDGQASVTRVLGSAGRVADAPGGRAELRLKRFAKAFPAEAWAEVDQRTHVSASAGYAARPWRLQVRSTAPLEVC